MNLMGKTSLEIVRVHEWMNWLSGTLHGAGFGHLFRPGRWTESRDETVWEGVKGRAREVVGECFDEIDGRLVEGSGWVVGGGMTAVDAYLFVFFRWGNEAGFDMRRKYPKYTKLMENFVKREKVKDTLERESICSTL